MLLKKLVLNNFKAYYGHQEINFYIPKLEREVEKKNIILIGGLNGSGKTTILKAIQYVLFGKRGISESEHKRIFSNVINSTYFEEGGRESALTLFLETDKGEEWELKIKWTFDHNKRPVNENREITVRKPGVKVGQHAHIANIEAYNRFIDRMIPYHAAPFFIFDGEEIKEIILRQNSADMKEAIHKISGVEAYNQLLEDLHSVKLSFERKLAKSVEIDRLNKTKNELDQVEGEISSLATRKDDLTTEKNRLEHLISEVKESRNQKIISNSKSREKIVIKQTQLNSELEHLLGEFREYYENNLVVMILAKNIKKLKDRLRVEKTYLQKKQVYESSLKPYKMFIEQLLSENINPPLTPKQLEQLRKIGEEVWIKENNIHISTSDELNILHDLNNYNYDYLLNIPLVGKGEIVQMINKIEALNNQIADIEIDMRNAPEEVDIQEENYKIDLYTKDLGQVELRLRSLNNRLARHKEEQRNLMNKLSKVTDSVDVYSEVKEQYEFTLRLIKGMEEYIAEMTLLKARFIHEEFATMLMKLFRKQGEFGKIEFDIDTYTIRLFNDREQEISIHDRSAGEMQMIASALIWALTKASDLSLPMVIDTPLGRLDSHHRNLLINNYYKSLSEQVIILSTDTEVTREYVTSMKEHSYRQYMLDYDQDKKYTIIREGYFEFLEV